MKKLLTLVLALCLALSMTSFAAAEENGTIMWLSNLSSGIQYETTRDYLTAICEKMGYKFTIVYGDGFNDAAGNLSAVQNGMTGDVVGIIASQDGGLAAIMEQYPDVYVAGYNSDMTSVFNEGGANAAVLNNDHFLGTICDGFADGANMGHQYFEVVKEKGWKRISAINFPGFAFPNQTAAVETFKADLEAYNATAADADKITLVGEPLTLEFQPLPDSYFLEEGMDDLDGIVAFCAGIQFVYPTLVTAKLNGMCRMDTQMITGGFDNNADIVADIGDVEDGQDHGLDLRLSRGGPRLRAGAAGQRHLRQAVRGLRRGARGQRLLRDRLHRGYQQRHDQGHDRLRQGGAGPDQRGRCAAAGGALQPGRHLPGPEGHLPLRAGYCGCLEVTEA